MMTIADTASRVKKDSFELAALSEEVRNTALDAIAKSLGDNIDVILEANEKDLTAGEKMNLSQPLMSRLKFDESKIEGVIQGLRDLIGLSDPLSKVLLKRELDKNLVLEKVTCPIGVIGVIFESRPDALVQIAGLCIKSGNGAILKGGTEAARTNKALYDIIHAAGIEAGLPKNFLLLVTNREDIGELLKCDDSVDLIIPRGSNEFVKYIMDNSNIPVMGHSDGICHVYVDKAADVKKAVPIIYDSKTQYVAACNATETILVHEDIADTLLPLLASEFAANDVIIKGCKKTQKIIEVEEATQHDFSTEYLDYVVSVKIVGSLNEAIDHINTFGSHHTDAILTEDEAVAEEFMMRVDSADVYGNCSTRFADGFRYGFGAEVGISTGKLHARGPVGLDGLVTYKYKLYGDGQIVSDYASGKREFHFKDI